MSNPQWNNPLPPHNPEEPKRPGFVKRHPVTTVFLILGALGILLIGGCAALVGNAANDASKSQPVTAPAHPAKPATPKDQPKADPATPEPAKPAPAKPAPKEPNEASDVTRFDLVDNSQDFGDNTWVDDVTIEYTVTNHSSKKSDYTIQWEVTDNNGVRIENSTEFVTTLAPGQTTTGSVPTVLTHQQVVDGATVKATDVNRSVDFSNWD